jgi:hypothetical protein
MLAVPTCDMPALPTCKCGSAYIRCVVSLVLFSNNIRSSRGLLAKCEHHQIMDVQRGFRSPYGLLREPRHSVSLGAPWCPAALSCFANVSAAWR